MADKKKARRKAYEGDPVMDKKKAVAKVMLDQGESLAQTAKMSGLSRTTVTNVRDGKYKLPPAMVDAMRAQVLDDFYMVRGKALTAMLEDDEGFKKQTPLQNITTAAIATDKVQLLEGKATSRIEFSVADESLRMMLHENLTRLAEIRGETITDAEYAVVGEGEGEPD